MIKKILLPRMSALMQTGIITSINVKSGQFVKKGDPILSIEAEKVNTEIDSPRDGYIKLQCKLGDELKVGSILALIGDSIDELKLDSKDGKVKPEQTNEKVIQERENTGEEILLEGIKKDMFEHMKKAKDYVQGTTFMEVDMGQVNKVRVQHKYSYTSFIAKAVIEALKKYPLINSTFLEGKILINKQINLGIAVDYKNKLFVPVIKNAENLGLEEIASCISKFKEKSERNSLTIDDLEGGTFTLTNSGIFGSSFFVPIINYPQSAILGIGKIIRRPVVYMDKISIRSIMILSLSYDHRIIEGSVAVRFLSDVKENLQTFNI